MSYIKNPHSDEPFADAETVGYMANRQARLASGPVGRARIAAIVEELPAHTSVEYWVLHCHSLLEAILGRPVALDGNDPQSLSKLVDEASRERLRLLSAVERNVETLAVHAESIASQQKLIAELSKSGTRGKAAYDAMMQVAIKIGINPVPTKAEELAASILAAIGAAPTEKGLQ